MAPSIDVITAPASNGDYGTLGQHFWNNNVPSSQWTQECPDFLLGLGNKNIGILSARQEDYRNITWEEAKNLVSKLQDWGSFNCQPSPAWLSCD